MDDLRFLKHALFGHLELCTGDQRCLNTFHRAVHGGFMDTPVIAQVRKRTVLTPKFQGHQELLSDAECRWAAGFLLPSLSFNQDGLHLGEDLRIHPSASTELLAVHLQRAGQAFLLHPLSLACDFRKRSIEDGVAEIGIAIGDSRIWGKGVGAAAGRLMLEWAFGSLCFQKVWADVHEPNARSLALMRKLGFTEVSRNGLEEYQGQVVPMVQFGLSRRTFLNNSVGSKLW